MSRLLTPPVPFGVTQAQGFRVWARALPAGTWQRVGLYAATVDMHQPRECAVGLFEVDGAAEVLVETDAEKLERAVVRPLRLGISAACDGNRVRFVLTRPADLMLELDGERFHCLHLLAGAIQAAPSANTLWMTAPQQGPNTAELRTLTDLPRGVTIAFAPGLHVIGEYLYRIPSGVNVYLAPGAAVVGGFIVENAEDVTISGHGVILQRSFERFSGVNGVRVSHSRRVRVEGVTFLNPPHYAVHLGGSEDVTINGVRAFSCEGWSDGIDMMSCRSVYVRGCFLRTSDDCIAVYGSRWDYRGDTADVLVENCALWADVAHPVNIGTHGDAVSGGDTLERLTFRALDILEHHEPQPEYAGCMAISAGDENTVQDVLFEGIRVERVAHGSLLDVRVRRNPDYNPAPGKQIRRVVFRDICCDDAPPMPSRICGYDDTRRVEDVRLQNVSVSGREVTVDVGTYTTGIEAGGDA